MFYKKIAHEILSKFTSNLIKTYKDFDIGEFDKILKKSYFVEHLQMAGSEFCTLLYVSLHKSFH